MRRLFIAALLLLQCTAVFAQNDDVWTLQRSIQFALQNNISIKQNVLNERLAKLSLQQSQLAQLPNANLNSSYGRSYGRSVDPTTNQFVDGSSYDYLSISGNADVLLFGWFQRRSYIGRDKYNLRAAQYDLEQLMNDVSLNVATGYLRALLAQEQIRVSEKQVELSAAQLDQTLKFADAGRLPELNVAQLQAQLAGDSANLITAISDYNSAILDIKAILNLNFDIPYTLQVPDVKVSEQIALSSMTPAQIYDEAAKNFGTIRGSEMRLAAAEKTLQATKGALLPQLGLGAQLGSNWTSTNSQYGVSGLKGIEQTQYFVLSDTLQPVYQPVYNITSKAIPLGTQLDNNFRQSISLNLNIPLFNAWQAQYGMRQAKINVLTQNLNKQNAALKLKQDVYKAYNDARNSVQKYYAAERAADAAQRAFNFAQKRYDLGLTNTVEYLTTQNTLYSADSRLASAKYDLIFKLKVIDYYLGKEIKL